MYKIMIIEDDRMLREDLARELEKAGFEPYILEDISSGEYLALKEQPDLLLQIGRASCRERVCLQV